MIHAPSYYIGSWPGCQKARMQAVSTADRPLCAAITCMAAYEKTGNIYGTLGGAPESQVAAWFDELLAHHGVDPALAWEWVAALCGETFPYTRSIPDMIRGIGPKGSDVKLDNYQLRVVHNTLISGGVVGGFMGSGKTAMAAAAAMAIGGELCAIECPLNAFPTWEKAKPELLKCFNKVLIFSVDSAHKYKALKGDVLIPDEVHRLGNGNARRTASSHLMRKNFRYCIPLTGTLLHAGVRKVLSIKDMAVPGLALFGTMYGAGEAFGCLVKKKIGSRTVTDLEKPTGENRERFLEWMSFGVQLLTPEDKEVKAVFQLPGQDLREVLFNAPWEALEETVARIANQVFAETGKFPTAAAVRHMLLRDGYEKKAEWIMGELADLEKTDQVAIAAFYTETLDHIEGLLKEQGYTYVRVDGQVLGEDRSEAERKFQDGEVQILLGQEHACSESINLQCATLSILVDVSQDAIDYSQFRARTHRRGSTLRCLHVDLVANVLQSRCLDRLRDGEDFNAEAADFQRMKRTIAEEQARAASLTH